MESNYCRVLVSSRLCGWHWNCLWNKKKNHRLYHSAHWMRLQEGYISLYLDIVRKSFCIHWNLACLMVVCGRMIKTQLSSYYACEMKMSDIKCPLSFFLVAQWKKTKISLVYRRISIIVFLYLEVFIILFRNSSSTYLNCTNSYFFLSQMALVWLFRHHRAR